MNFKAALYRMLASQYGYSPMTIADMTIAQQILLTSEETTGVLHFNDEAQLNTYLQGKRT